ncbi:MAG: hypothetical protein IJC75_01565 [Oscillospiraceae bacterium]|nr:hypothetical protein [Oscillospiraceae bacterium]
MDKQYFKGPFKGARQIAIADSVADALQTFCTQEPEFAQAIEQSGKSFQQCLDAVVKGAGSSLSDLEAYRRAVKFYFSTASVHFHMQIDLCGENGHKAPPITQTKQPSMELSLDALLDF